MSVRTVVKSIQDIMRKDSGVDGDAQRISQLCWLFFLKIIDDQDQELELMRDGYQSPVPEQFQWRNWAAEPEGLTGEALLAFVNDELFPAMKGLKPTSQPGDRRRVVRDVFEDAYNYMKSGQLLRQACDRPGQLLIGHALGAEEGRDLLAERLDRVRAGCGSSSRRRAARTRARLGPRPPWRLGRTPRAR